MLQPVVDRFVAGETAEAAVGHTSVFMRSLTLAQAPVRWLIDAVSINLFRKIGLERTV